MKPNFLFYFAKNMHKSIICFSLVKAEIVLLGRVNVCSSNQYRAKDLHKFTAEYFGHISRLVYFY